MNASVPTLPRTKDKGISALLSKLPRNATVNAGRRCVVTISGELDSRSTPIKGPGLKLNLDVRRCWQCPACGRQIKRLGDVVTYQCHCQDPPVWMRLMEAPRAARVYQPYIVPEIHADEWIGEEETPAVEQTLPVDAADLMEAALPTDLEELPVEEEFFPQEEEIGDGQFSREVGVPEIVEPEPAQPALDSGESSEQQPAHSTEPKPNPGRSKRKRSGRKRSRRRGNQPDGGESG